MFNPTILNDDNDLECMMTLQEFIECVKGGGFIDSDGFAFYATETHHDDSVFVYPSMIRFAPKGVTHILWFNN